MKEQFEENIAKKIPQSLEPHLSFEQIVEKREKSAIWLNLLRYYKWHFSGFAAIVFGVILLFSYNSKEIKDYKQENVINHQFNKAETKINQSNDLEISIKNKTTNIQDEMALQENSSKEKLDLSNNSEKAKISLIKSKPIVNDEESSVEQSKNLEDVILVQTQNLHESVKPKQGNNVLEQNESVIIENISPNNQPITHLEKDLQTENSKENQDLKNQFELDEKSSQKKKDTKNPLVNNWSLDYSYGIGMPMFYYSRNDEVALERKQNEKLKMSTLQSLNVNYKLNNRIEFGIGLNYHQINFDYSEQGNLIINDTNITSREVRVVRPGQEPYYKTVYDTAITSTNKPTNINYDNSFSVLQIPLKIYYFIPSNKIMFRLGGGIGLDLLQINNAYLPNWTESKVEKVKYPLRTNSVNTQLLFSFDAMYKLSNHLWLKSGWNSSLQLMNAARKDANYGQRFGFHNINLGLRYEF